jgi:hypothetical protein
LGGRFRPAVARWPFPPPWEWVDGDTRRVAQFALGCGLVLGVFGCLLGILLLSSLRIAVVGDPFGIPPVALQLLSWGFLIPELACFWYFPRKYPILLRLGISPVGLRIVLLLRTINVSWPALEEVGQDWIKVSQPLDHVRYQLTAHQMERLRRFIRSPVR